MNEEESAVFNIVKDKIEEAMQLVPNLSSQQPGGLQMWVNALQSGKDVQFNLSTSENGFLQITLVEPNDNRQATESNNEVGTNEGNASDTCNQTVQTASDDCKPDKSKSTDWGFFRDDKGTIVAHPIDEVLNNSDGKWTDAGQAILEPNDYLIEELPMDLEEKRLIKPSAEVDHSSKSEKSNNESEDPCADAPTTKSTIIVTITSDNNSNATEPESSKKQILKPDPANPDIFPCVRPEWYIKPPADLSKELVDDVCEVNTIAVANDMRSYLRHKAISLANFSQNYLQRTQGTLSDLLNHPKPWTGLSARGRQIYLKMMQFLNAENLHDVVGELKEAYLTVRPGPSTNVLPSDVLSMLENGEIPAKSHLASLALKFGLDEYHLRSYCETHLRKPGSTDAENTDSGKQTEKENPKVQPLKKISSLRSGFKPRYNDKQICPIFGCGFILGSKPALESHLLFHTGERPYKCSKCEKRFSTLSNVRTHERRHNQTQKVSKRAQKVAILRKESEKVSDEKPTDSSSEKAVVNVDKTERSTGVKLQRFPYKHVYACGVCTRRFTSRQLLHNHITAAHSAAKMRDKNRLFTCHMCSKSLKTMASLVVHLRTHNGDRPYCCQFCKKRFHTKANCLRHSRSHTGTKPFKCDKCSATFTEASSVATHMRIHTGEKPYECETCSKRFSQSGPLIAHRLVHTGCRPYLCAVCGRSFRQKTNLRAHEQRHAGLRRHACQICSHAFQYKNDLMRHMLKHSGERPYMCKICSLRFTRLQYLKEHVRRVHDLAPYKCEHYNVGFPHKGAVEPSQVAESETQFNSAPEKTLSENGSGQDYTSILQVLSNAICCISPLSPANSANVLDQTSHISTVMDDTDPSLVSSNNASSSFTIGPSETGPVTFVTNRAIVFASPDGIDASLLSAAEPGSTGDHRLAMISKIPPMADADADPSNVVVADGSDPNMQSVIVASEDCDDLEEGARYVVVSVAGDVATITNPSQHITLESADV